MPLDPRVSLPSNRSYVLKLHRNARPEAALLRGRLENIATGSSVEFHNVDELLSFLASDAGAATPTAPGRSPPRSPRGDT